MRTIRFFAAMIAVFAICSVASAQELKPLRDFYNPVEYLEYNFTREKEQFKGRSLSEFLNEVEVEFRAVQFSGGNLIFLIQEYEYLADNRIKEKIRYETDVYFERDNILKAEMAQLRDFIYSDPTSGGLYPLTQENKDKLIEILKNAKIRFVIYREEKWYLISH